MGTTCFVLRSSAQENGRKTHGPHLDECVDAGVRKDGSTVNLIKMRRSTMAAFILAGSVTAAYSETSQYLCISDVAVGLAFQKETQSWHPQTFKAGLKYIFRKINDEEQKYSEAFHLNWKWVFIGFGDAHPLYGCDDSAKYGGMRCGNLSINLKTLRFQVYRVGMFVEPDPESEEDKGDDPVLEIGKCTPL